jgi:hypothetical protein
MRSLRLPRADGQDQVSSSSTPNWLAGHQLGTHFDRLDRAGGTSLEHQADTQQNHSEEEQAAGAEHQNADPAQEIRRRAHHGSKDTADGSRLQLVPWRDRALHADQSRWDSHVADHHDRNDDAEASRKPREPVGCINSIRLASSAESDDASSPDIAHRRRDRRHSNLGFPHPQGARAIAGAAGTTSEECAHESRRSIGSTLRRRSSVHRPEPLEPRSGAPAIASRQPRLCASAARRLSARGSRASCSSADAWRAGSVAHRGSR